jgi:parallel beta-helix repeat protein
MNNIQRYIYGIIGIIMLASVLAGSAGAATLYEDDGIIMGNGTHFEVTNSSYFNITLDSADSINLMLESIPGLVYLGISSDSSATSTQINLSGFMPNTRYYRYEDSYESYIPMDTDGNGNSTFTQDLSTGHSVYIQPNMSTIHIRDNPTGGDCTSIGTWNNFTKTCTLNTNVTQNIEINNNNITLDGNGYNVSYTSGPSGNGVQINQRRNVTVKNLTITKFSNGINLERSKNCSLINNNASFNERGINVLNSDHNILMNNTVQSNKNDEGIQLVTSLFGLLGHSDWNNLTNNSAFLNKHDGIQVILSQNNNLTNNSAFLNQQDGIDVALSQNNNLTNNSAFLNQQDGIYMLGVVFVSQNNNLNMNNASFNMENGIKLEYSYTNNLANNTANSNSEYGIKLDHSDNNNVASNTVMNNTGGGISLDPPIQNLFYNNLFNNTKNFDVTSSSNKWNITKTLGTNIISGPNLGGNAWFYPNGSGFSWFCADLDEDGICDAQYNLSSHNIDYLPLALKPVLPVPIITVGGIVNVSHYGEGKLENLTDVDPATLPPPPAGVNLVYGLFSFNIRGITPGNTTNVTLTFPTNLPPGTTYWKYNATVGWYSIPCSINGRNVTISLTDGGLGDEDGIANGNIFDTGGPSLPKVPVPATSTAGLVVLVGMLTAIGMLALRKK